MKALILAAGQGTRMGKYTENIPKGMLEFDGKSLIERQLEVFRMSNIDQVIIATGYRKEMIKLSGVKYFHNPDFANTNMIETLFCARNEFTSDMLVVYSDIMFTENLLRSVMETEGSIVVAVDSAWRKYWEMRYGTTEHDLETLTVKNGRIAELGRAAQSSIGIDYRYIGMIKFSERSWAPVMRLYDNKKLREEIWEASGRGFRQGYMTDLLNELIGRGVDVIPCVTEKQWLEFDTERDYEIALENLKGGTLGLSFDN